MYNKETKTGVDVVHNYPEQYSGHIINSDILVPHDKDKYEIFNFFIAGWNNCVRNQNNKLAGLVELKIIQSKLLGFCPIVVSKFKCLFML